MLGSHSFVSAITDGETFWSGLAIFIVSNYTVIVWAVVDLMLILSARNISKSSYLLNEEIAYLLENSPDEGKTLNKTLKCCDKIGKYNVEKSKFEGFRI